MFFFFFHQTTEHHKPEQEHEPGKNKHNKSGMTRRYLQILWHGSQRTMIELDSSLCPTSRSCAAHMRSQMPRPHTWRRQSGVGEGVTVGSSVTPSVLPQCPLARWPSFSGSGGAASSIWHRGESSAATVFFFFSFSPLITLLGCEYAARFHCCIRKSEIKVVKAQSWGSLAGMMLTGTCWKRCVNQDLSEIFLQVFNYKCATAQIKHFSTVLKELLLITVRHKNWFGSLVALINQRRHKRQEDSAPVTVPLLVCGWRQVGLKVRFLLHCLSIAHSLGSHRLALALSHPLEKLQVLFVATYSFL